MMSMMSSLKKGEITPETKAEILELQAQTYLNMSICFFKRENYFKAVEKATDSIKLKKSYKAYYRRGMAYAKLLQYDNAAEDMLGAIKMDTSDPQNIQHELNKFKREAAKQDKERLEKLSGFLLR